MDKNSEKWRKACLYAAVVLTLVSTVYWGLFALNAYNTFHEFEALGFYANNMYYTINYFQSGNPLQVLVVGNHIAPDQLFALIVYYFAQSPLALLFLQDVVLSLTGLLVFFVARDLLKSNGLGIAFCFLYLINPGVHGMLVFDYHAEVFFIPFYIMTFYYYMKLNKRMFYISSILLLGVIDVAPILAGTLAVGLAAYEWLYDNDKAQRGARLRMSAALIVMTIATLLLYNLIYFELVGSYASYPSVPAQVMVYAYPLVPFYFTGGTLPCTGCVEQFAFASGGEFAVYATLGFGLMVGLLGFGPALAFVALPALIFLGPWLYGALVGGDSVFLSIYMQYMSYVVGGAFAASVLGLMRLKARKGVKKPDGLMLMLISFTASFTVLLAVVSPGFSYSLNITNLTQSYLFTSTPMQHADYAQLDSVISKIPQNASLMAQDFVTPRAANRQYLELVSDTPSFAPQYILVDFNYNISYIATGNGTIESFEEYTSNHTYQLVAQNGTAMLYRQATAPAT